MVPVCYGLLNLVLVEGDSAHNLLPPEFLILELQHVIGVLINNGLLITILLIFILILLLIILVLGLVWCRGVYEP